MSDSYSVLSEDTGTRDSVLPVCVTPQFEAAGPVFRNAEMWLYRERTIALLRRYLRISIEVGRLPSLLGRELFRSKVTSYRMSSFEDAVIFVHDVERALSQLDGFAKQVKLQLSFRITTKTRRPRCFVALAGPSVACFHWQWTR